MSPPEDQWIYPGSTWVYRFYFDSDDGLFVQFNNGFCCRYPFADYSIYVWLYSWYSKGNFIDEFFKKYHVPYVACAPPPG